MYTQAQVDNRIKEEKLIMRHCIRELLSHGLTLSVHDGEEIALSKSTNNKEIFEAMYSTDEDRLIAYKDGQRVGTVYFVYGNSSFEVISDYSTTMEQYLTSTVAYAEKFDK